MPTEVVTARALLLGPRRRLQTARGDAFVREGGSTIAWGVATYGLGLLTGPMLARALGASGRGSLAAVVVPTQVLVFLLAFGMPAAAGYLSDRIRPAQLLATIIASTIVVGGPVVAVLWQLAPSYLDGHDPMTIAPLRVLLVLALLGVPALAVLEMRRAASADTTFNILRSLPVLANALLTTGLFALGALTLRTALLVAVASVAVGAAATLATAGYRPSLRLSSSATCQVWSFGLRSFPGTISNTLLGRFDQLLLVGVATPSELGFYAVAVSAANVTVPIGQGAASAVLPALRRGDLSTSREVLTAAGTVLVVAASVCGLLAVTGPTLIPQLFGDPFRASVLPLLLMLPGQAAAAAGEVAKADLVAQGRPERSSLAQAVAAGVTVCLLPPAVAWWGINGAAGVASLGNGAMAATAVVLSLRLDRSGASGAARA